MSSRKETRPYTKGFIDGYSAMGHSTMYVTCPFCDEELEVYIWSFYGSGKLCNCGALLWRYGANKEIR